MTKMKIYRVYFKDGNQKLFEAQDIGTLVRHLENNIEHSYSISDITKIEEAKIWK